MYSCRVFNFNRIFQSLVLNNNNNNNYCGYRLP